MIAFDQGGVRFNFRVAGVALHRDRVLLHRAESDNYWALPGGRVELGEPAATALAREMQDEVAERVQVGRLLWVAESFFAWGTTLFHELGLYFLIEFAPDSPIYCQVGPFTGDEFGLRLIFEWFPLATLKEVPLFPVFLRRGLQEIPAAPVHILDRVDKKGEGV